MAKANSVSAITLELNQEEAEFLRGLIFHATDFSEDPVAEDLYDALSGHTNGSTFFELIDNSYFSAKK